MCKQHVIQLLAVLFLLGIAEVHSSTLPPPKNDTEPNAYEAEHYRWQPAYSTRKIFNVSLDRKNWLSALQTCHQQGMELAAIDSQLENFEALRVIQAAGLSGQAIWTGGNDLAIERMFTWVTTGKPITFTYWGPDEPNNYNKGWNQNCVLFNTHGGYYSWGTDDCAREQFYLCQGNNYYGPSYPAYYDELPRHSIK